MYTSRELARRADKGVANERIYPRVREVHIIDLEIMNEAITTPKPKGPQGPQIPTMSQALQAHFIEGDMTNVELRDALMNLTQLMRAQAQVFTNHFCFPS